MRLRTVAGTVLAVSLLVGALSLVTWRQARVREVLAELDDLRREISLVEAERGELEERIRFLESRGRVVPAARERLGMKTPSSSEIVLLNRGEG